MTDSAFTVFRALSDPKPLQRQMTQSTDAALVITDTISRVIVAKKNRAGNGRERESLAYKILGTQN